MQIKKHKNIMPHPIIGNIHIPLLHAPNHEPLTTSWAKALLMLKPKMASDTKITFLCFIFLI
jgi:hypothetical protein